MSIIQIAAIGIISVILILVIKKQRPEFAMLISIISGIVIFFAIAFRLQQVLDIINEMLNKTGTDSIYFKHLIKALGIAYVSEFAADLCRDSGQSSIAGRIELAGKIIIIYIAAPIITSIINLINQMI